MSPEGLDIHVHIICFARQGGKRGGKEVAVVLTLCGCMGMPLKSVTILLADVMCTGRMPVLNPPI